MNLLRIAAVTVLAAFLAGCMTSRSPFTPEGGPPTVGMPAELSERERTFVTELDGALRNQGYLPVRHGAGDMQLEFEIAEGPINTDTSIELYDGSRLLAQGRGRASGAPMFNRAQVARTSFDRAFGEFQGSLSGAPGGGALPGGYDQPPAWDDPDYGY